MGERIYNCMKSCDIKLIRRNNETINELKSDIHIQIYFGDLRKRKDNFLKNVDIDFSTIGSDDKSIDYIYDSLLAKSYLKRTFLVGWIDKVRLIENCQKREKESKPLTWTFNGSKRSFWHCNILTEARKPNDMIDYFKDLLKNKPKNRNGLKI